MTDAPALPREAVDSWLHLSSPRVRFLKSLPLGARVLDLGAGEGSMVTFREWLEPHRPDLKLFALSLQKGAHFDRYDGFEVGDFEKDEPFGGTNFDAVITSHFIEHINGGVKRVLPWIASRLRPGGLLYAEIPSEQSKHAPKASDLRAQGYDVTTTNFFDDRTHIATVSLDILKTEAEQAGFFVEEAGYWRNRLLEPLLLDLAKQTGNSYYAHAHFWMKTRFAQYIMAERL